MNIKYLEARLLQSLIASLMLISGSHGKAQSYCNPNLDYLKVWDCNERTATFDAVAYQNVSKYIKSFHKVQFTTLHWQLTKILCHNEIL